MTDRTPVDKNERLVIGYFASKEQAEIAVDALHHWDTINAAVKLGNIGILVKEEGKIKTIAPRRGGKGAALGLGIGAIAAVLSGGLTLVGGLLAGGVFGGAVGALFKKSLGLSPEDVEQIAQQLDGGQAAVVVMCDDYEIDGVIADMKQSGGVVSSYDMSSALLPEAEKAVNDAVGATKAVVGGVTAVAASAATTIADSSAAVTGSGAGAVKQAADVTSDAVKKGADATAGAVKQAADATAGVVKQAADATSGAVKKTADATGDAVKKTADATAETAKRAAVATAGVAKDMSDKAPEAVDAAAQEAEQQTSQTVDAAQDATKNPGTGAD
jgi:hypothetical protein